MGGRSIIAMLTGVNLLTIENIKLRTILAQQLSSTSLVLLGQVPIMITLSLHLLFVGVVGSVGNDVVDAFYSSEQIRCFEVHLVSMVRSVALLINLLRV